MSRQLWHHICIHHPQPKGCGNFWPQASGFVPLYHFLLQSWRVTLNSQTRHNNVWPMRYSLPKTTLTLKVILFSFFSGWIELNCCLVYPIHAAFVLINENGGEAPGAGGASLFSSVVSRVGGDPVSCIIPVTFTVILSHILRCRWNEASRSISFDFHNKVLHPMRPPFQLRS